MRYKCGMCARAYVYDIQGNKMMKIYFTFVEGIECTCIKRAYLAGLETGPRSLRHSLQVLQGKCIMPMQENSYFSE